IPRDLLESELFGHERGAFTGAHTQRAGRFEQADGGTLFLDEIGDMPLELQTRLLRVLAEGEFYRVGGHTPVAVKVRIITATNKDPEQLVAAGKFREDLFHRLNVMRIHIPPLRERREDIPALLTHYLRAAARDLGTEEKHLSEAAVKALSAYHWPGNVRELCNLCHRLSVMAAARYLDVADIPSGYVDRHTPDRELDWVAPLKNWVENKFHSGEKNLSQRSIEKLERALIDKALEFTGGHRQQAAKLLGYGRNTLTRKIKEYGL
ncbi:MAG: sigma 54-interacting transcriptional regulator, partial [Gammaproteobacteria bacterium]|nr:sigma 54-interacting transcriptional regulator [Gammaproteobacteria bacterium]